MTEPTSLASWTRALRKQLDALGLDLVWFTEHHFLEDGYLPSWIPVASAMAMRCACGGRASAAMASDTCANRLGA